MRIVLMLMTLIISMIAKAEIYRSRIHSLDKGSQREPHLLLLEDGHVVFLDGKTKTDEDVLQAIHRSRIRGDWVEVEVNEKLSLLSIRTMARRSLKRKNLQEPPITYEPTVTTATYARQLFRNMRRDYQNDSQCYNRAHVWSYEEFQRSGFQSMKLFLFFTSKYIRSYRYHWWFHVTPMVYVNQLSDEGRRALDRRYTRAPLSIKTWTNIFMYNDATCKVVNRYYDYRNHQQAEWCYLIPVSMYFWQPRDIERRDRTGYEKTSFINREIEHAYWEAF
jgi:hypothetical protein